MLTPARLTTMYLPLLAVWPQDGNVGPSFWNCIANIFLSNTDIILRLIYSLKERKAVTSARMRFFWRFECPFHSVLRDVALVCNHIFSYISFSKVLTKTGKVV